MIQPHQPNISFPFSAYFIHVSLYYYYLTFTSVLLFQCFYTCAMLVLQDYSVEVYLTMYWLDERLVFQNLSTSRWLEVDTKMMDRIWVPDVYFRNEKEASFHEVTVPNKYMHLYPNGTVIYSMR